MDWASLPLWLKISLISVGSLIIIASIVALVISIVLAIKYVKYNKKQNSAGLTGEQVARKVLDDNNLQKIKVKCSGSILFGNSYSHFFKKVRLRRLTWKKQSLTSLGIAAQKAALAVMDKENDPDMRTKVRLTPFSYFGPLFCIPLILIGIILDILVFNFSGFVSIASIVLGLAIYVIAFWMSIVILKTEKKAQKRAYTILKDSKMATDEELRDLKELFHLYNIEYVNNLIVALLEVIYRILLIIAKILAKKN